MTDPFCMTAVSAILISRIAWIDAYLAHYAAERDEVLSALGVEGHVLDELREELRARIESDRSRGDVELATRYADEYTLARRTLADRALALDDVVVSLAARKRDELALPDATLAPREGH